MPDASIHNLTLSIHKKIIYEAAVEYYGKTLYDKKYSYAAIIGWQTLSSLSSPYPGDKSVCGSGDTPSDALNNVIAALKEEWKEHPVFKDGDQ